MHVNNRNNGPQIQVNEGFTAVRAGDLGQMTSSAAPPKDSLSSLLNKSGIDSSMRSELKGALNILSKKGYTLSKESVNILQQFLKTQPGSLEDKLSSIQALAQKKLEITPTHLSAIHEALHGNSVVSKLQEYLQGTNVPWEQDLANRFRDSKTMSREQITDLIKNIKKQIKDNPTSDLKSLVEAIEKNNSLPQAMKNEILKAIQLIEAGNSRFSTSPLDAAKLQQMGLDKLDEVLQGLKTSNPVANTENETEDALQKMLQNVIKDVQKEASLAKVFDSVKQLLTQLSKEDGQELGTLRSSLDKATQYAKQGQELAAREELTQALAKIEEENPQLQKSTNAIALTKADQYLINEAVQSLNLDSKNILVTEISSKLSQLAIDFKKMKRDITKNLDQIIHTYKENKPISPMQIKQQLDSAIKKLDNAILKGNFLLYADMETEKKLLIASSQLAEAKSLVMKGNHTEANQIVKEVKTLLDQLVYKPSDVRVKHFVSEQSLLLKEMHPAKQLSLELQQAIKPFPEHEPSARHIFETVRRLGLMNENELAQSFIGTPKGEQDMSSNLKATLLKMMQLEDGQFGKHTQSLDQAITNLTGQQLLSKYDSSGMQNLFMQLPMLLNKQVENIKVYLNSQNKSETIDWENCSLYFVLETKRLGDVGIMVTATNRNLSITLKNDRVGFQERMKLLTETTVHRLKEIGYNVGTIQYKPFSPPIQEKTEASLIDKNSTPKPATAKKGYDYSV